MEHDFVATFRWMTPKFTDRIQIYWMQVYLTIKNGSKAKFWKILFPTLVFLSEIHNYNKKENSQPSAETFYLTLLRMIKIKSKTGLQNWIFWCTNVNQKTNYDVNLTTLGNICSLMSHKDLKIRWCLFQKLFPKIDL